LAIVIVYFGIGLEFPVAEDLEADRLKTVPRPVAVHLKCQRDEPMIRQVLFGRKGKAMSGPAQACSGYAVSSRTPPVRLSC
jgi:hypothetical protein